MVIKNVIIYTEEQRFREGELYIRDGLLGEGPGEGEVIDGERCYAVPGFIDLHLHGCMGSDVCDGSPEAVSVIAEYEAQAGITGIVPATMTLPAKELEGILAAAAEYKRSEGAKGNRADLLGINMEGPFISKAKKGAQDPKHVISCSVETAERFIGASEGLVRFIGIAPEDNPDYLSFIRALKGKVNISLAHTNADYRTAMEAFRAGANHAVHLFNAMPPFLHRDPGVVGAVADSSWVYAELICDGVHIHPAVVRAVFSMLGKERIVFISDSMRAAGMPDGTYTLGGLEVKVEGKKAMLTSDGALAGSASTLSDCVRTAVKEMDIPLEDAVACASVNPARCLGIYGERGSLSPGKRADIVLLDRDLKVKAVIKDGRRIR